MAIRWDIFCRVIDNYGDIGVSWRLAADLAARGLSVRLWVDDARALAWMAPGALHGHWPGVQVLDWDLSRDPATLATLAPADVWIEAFGCDIAPEFLAHHLGDCRARGFESVLEARQSRESTAAVGLQPVTPKSDRLPGPPSQPEPPRQPVWINLEYLSAEKFAERAHGLPSPVMQGVAKGCTKYFYYPGFTPASGGLLREQDLSRRQAGFDRATWLAGRGIRWRGERLVSLFCYEPAALEELLTLLRQDALPTRLLVTDGRASAAARAAIGPNPGATGAGQLSVDFLAPLTHTDFDHLLWSCDLNFVRGEDSVVRAIWAGKAFVWQIYPQHDNAHQVKLQAFLDALQAPPSWRQMHALWNRMEHDRAAAPRLDLDLVTWSHTVAAARQRLLDQGDLSGRLQAFVAAARKRQIDEQERG